MAIFGPKQWVNLFGKISIFWVLEFFYLQPRKAFFWFQNIVKDIFLAYISKKIKVGEIVIFGPKPSVNPFGKCQFFDFLNFLFFIAQKGVFSFQNILKDIFLAYIAEKQELKIWPFLYKNNELTPLEKCQFFDFLYFLFLQPQKTFFRSRRS